MLSAQYLRKVLDYAPETGRFTWRISVPHSPRKAGDDAGTFDVEGYRRIVIQHKSYRAHRLAWLYLHDEWPLLQIDHVNGDKADNRIANLRLVTTSQNQQNLKAAHRDSASGVLGIVWVKKRKKWEARVRLNGKSYYAGQFDDPQEAHKSYVRAKRQLHTHGTLNAHCSDRVGWLSPCGPI